MVLRLVILFVILVNLEFSVSFGDELFADVTQPLSADDHKILQECHNEDYKTYLRCLKRQKRHHDIPGSSKSCLDDCIIANCTSSSCVHDCYTRCKKKITETYSKVTETEYDCSGGSCNVVDHSKVPNVTTNVNITIGLNNGSNCNNTKESPRRYPKNEETEKNDSSDSSKFTINNIITNVPGSESSNCRCPGCNCFPWPAMPQITIGFGPGPVGVGCCFPQPCTCYQQPQRNIDCGDCENPFLRYRCDVSCNHPGSGRSSNITGSRYGTSRL